jgi:uncharacterized membrane protein YjgN (DUF898 family)
MTISADTEETVAGTAYIGSAKVANPELRPSYPMSFTGSGDEYFPIWLSNLALTIFTIGLYSPWAKVRRERYFLGNTWLNESNFDYTANPFNILKGRLLVLAFLVFYAVFVDFIPGMQYPMILLLFVLFAWAFCQAMRFRCRNTQYRGLRFGFSGTFRSSLHVHLLWRFLGLITLGLLHPLAKHKEKKFKIDNLHYGNTPFQLNSTVLGFYLVYLALIGALAVFLVAFGVTFASNFAAGAQNILDLQDVTNLENPDFELSFGLIWLGLLSYSIIFFLLFPALRCLLNKLTWNKTGVKDFTITYDIGLLRYLFIAITNLILIVLTLGMAHPFAKVRMYKYKVNSLKLHGSRSPEEFVNNEKKEVGALGDQYLNDFDLGVDLGF